MTESIEEMTLRELQAGDLRYDAWEALPVEQNQVKVPSFHYLTWRRDGLMVGYCVDFDLLVHSADPDDSKAHEKVWDRMTSSAIQYFATLILTDSIEEMYANQAWEFQPGFGSLYSARMNQQRIEDFKRSLGEYTVRVQTSDLSEDDPIDSAELDTLREQMEENEQEYLALRQRIAGILSQHRINNVVAFTKRQAA